MKTNGELRKEAREALRGLWLWRLLGVIFALQAVANAARHLLSAYNREAGVVEISAFIARKAAALQEGLDFALPSQEAYRRMLLAGGLEYLVGALFGAIALFGVTAVVLRALRDDSEGWLSSGFGGFRRPLDVTFLFLAQNLIVAFWTLVLVVPGIVAAYRYRLAWYLKCENPDWGAWKCLGESARMMKGFKGRAFGFDLGFLAMMFPAALALAACAHRYGVSGGGIGFAVCALVFSAATLALVYLTAWFVTGRAAFYREVKSLQPEQPRDDLSRND